MDRLHSDLRCGLPVDVVIAGHQSQSVDAHSGGFREELEPALGDLVLIWLRAEGNIAGHEDPIRRRRGELLEIANDRCADGLLIEAPSHTTRTEMDV